MENKVSSSVATALALLGIGLALNPWNSEPLGLAVTGLALLWLAWIWRDDVGRKWKSFRQRGRWGIAFTAYPGPKGQQGGWAVLAAEFHNYPGRRSSPLYGIHASVEIREEGSGKVVARNDAAGLYEKPSEHLYAFGDHPTLIESFVPQPLPLVFGVVEQNNPEGHIMLCDFKALIPPGHYEASVRVNWSNGGTEGRREFAVSAKPSSLRWRDG